MSIVLICLLVVGVAMRRKNTLNNVSDDILNYIPWCITWLLFLFLFVYSSFHLYPKEIKRSVVSYKTINSGSQIFLLVILITTIFTFLDVLSSHTHWIKKRVFHPCKRLVMFRVFKKTQSKIFFNFRFNWQFFSDTKYIGISCGSSKYFKGRKTGSRYSVCQVIPFDHQPNGFRYILIRAIHIP